MEKKIINLYPATRWMDASPIGNGRLGGCVYGCVYDERILINHEALYNYTVNFELPDVSGSLGELRSLMDQKKYKEANDLYPSLIKETGFRSHKGKFFPAFDIHILFETNGAMKDYQRVIDMENGTCTVSYKDESGSFVRTSFVSQSDGYFVMNIKKDAPFTVQIALEKHDMVDFPDPECYDTFSSFSKDRYVYSEMKTFGDLDYSGIIKILSTDGDISAIERGRAKRPGMVGDATLGNCVKVSGATAVTFILDVAEKALPFEKMRESVDKCTLTYDKLYKNHTEIFKNVFNRTRLTLCENEENKSNEELLLSSYSGNVDTRLFEKMADYGRYLLISSSYGCEFPANLQGLWNGDYSPAWACTFFNNENIQMAYWQAYMGNLSDTVLPLFNLYDKFKDDYRRNAANLFGCRGLLLPLFMDNSNGKKENLQPHVLYWTGSSAWISAIYYDYYLYTRDEKFLLERAYPFMKEALLFYEDFTVYDENGKLKFYPSNSPENYPKGDFEGAGQISVCMNATMDFALLKELTTNVLSVAKKFGLDGEKIEDWEKILSSIPEYEINEDGAIKEWLHEDFKDNYYHRHLSHIYPLFPGFEINEENNKKLFDACKTAVEKRLCIGLKDQTGWSLSHMANIYARLNDAQRSKECLELLLRFCTGPNFFTYHNDWRNMGVTLKFTHAGHAPFQIDANLGFTAAIYEMLIYSDNDKIKLLPALSEQFKKGKIENICARGGYEVSINWENESFCATVTSKNGGSINIGTNKNYSLVSSSVPTEKSVYGESFSLITLKKGESVKLKYTSNC
ncbi:MAG: glycoside hydrolase N-terminal domain-containing protein [Clostridia bacterium]|nr:glycoside hydrolase N-terminal domain-containing protein [Clostridia bacterium]